MIPTDYAFGREQFAVFAHSRAAADQNPLATWRQGPTLLRLQPQESAWYRFALRGGRDGEPTRVSFPVSGPEQMPLSIRLED